MVHGIPMNSIVRSRQLDVALQTAYKQPRFDINYPDDQGLYFNDVANFERFAFDSLRFVLVLS